MYTLPYVKWITGGNLLYATGNPKFWDNLEGWDGEGGGGRGHTMANSCWCMAETITIS